MLTGTVLGLRWVHPRAQLPSLEKQLTLVYGATLGSDLRSGL